MTKANRLEDAFLDLVLRNNAGGGTNVLISNNLAAVGAGAGSTNLFLSLHTAGLGESPSNGQNQNETSYGSYVRLSINRNATNWDNLSPGLFANGNTTNFTFATVTSGTPTLTHWALGTTTNDSGEVLYSGPLSDSDPQPFTSEEGNVTNALTVISHGHASNDEVILIALPNVTFPSGVSSNTVVYVNLSNGGESALPDTTDFLRIASTAGGVPLDIGSGAGLIAGMNSQTLAVNNTPRFVTNALRITED